MTKIRHALGSAVVIVVLLHCASAFAHDCDVVVQSHVGPEVFTDAPCPIPGCPSGNTTVTIEWWLYGRIQGGYPCDSECQGQSFQNVTFVTCANCPMPPVRNVLDTMTFQVCPGDTSWTGYEGAVGY